MFGEIPVEISPSPSGNANRGNTEATFEETTMVWAKKTNSKSFKAAADTLPVTKNEEASDKPVQVSDSGGKQSTTSTVSNTLAPGSEVKRKAILSMLKK